jgi:hypothetical protein
MLSRANTLCHHVRKLKLMKIKAIYGITNSAALNLNAAGLSEINEGHLLVDLKKPTIAHFLH